MRQLVRYCQYFTCFIFVFSCEKQDAPPLISSKCHQAIVVVTDSVNATVGSLQAFQRESNAHQWVQAGHRVPIALGRNGLAWGKGLHKTQSNLNYPVKSEGDGRSPAGMFNLSSVFGYQPEKDMDGLKMPYLHVTEYVECIDDVRSKHYAEIISRDTLSNANQIDWTSSEKMALAGIYYELGVVVDHNLDPVSSSGGSCIFLHNWAEPNETTAGCTAMSPPDMQTLVHWLNIEKQPVLIQLTRQSYAEQKASWGLPEIE